MKDKPMTRKVSVELGDRSYEILISDGILNDIGKRLGTFYFSPRMAVISNPTVFGIYGNRVIESIKASGFEPSSVIIPDGEEYKDSHWYFHILSELLKLGLDRKSAILALGGGVVGDIAGFAASTFMRGIDYIQIPTTMLAQVDSSVGGKTGINHPLGKNMIGTFYQPRLVWIDTETLKTLPERERLAGISEVIKYGVIWDRDLFDYLKEKKDKILSYDPDALGYIIKRSCEIKAEVVSKDEREAGLRAILNFGHTIGHALETVTGYNRFLHGEAVSIGMYIEARIAVSMSLINISVAEEIRSIIEYYGLQSDLPDDIDINVLIKAMNIDKKAVHGELSFILPQRIGSVRIVKGIERDRLLSILKTENR